MIYLDHSATSPMTPAVIEAMWPYLNQHFANAASQHEPGKVANAGLQAARTVVAEVFGVASEEVFFTSGGTESNNLAIKGIALAAPKNRHIITTAIEHEAVLQSCVYLKKYHDFNITVLPVDREGFVDLAVLEESLTEGTTLVSVQYANNEVGTIQDIEAIAAICRKKDVPFHTDAVQAAGQLPLNVDASLISISAHKFGGPKGIGALVKRNNIFLEPLLHGGGQERGSRSGTSNVAGAVGLAAALHLADANRNSHALTLTALRDQLIEGVFDAWPGSQLSGSRHHRLAHHASFTFEGSSGESILLDLEAQGIACSSGSACAAGSQEPSHVLMAMNYSKELAETAVRFTLGIENTQAEIARTIAVLRELAR